MSKNRNPIAYDGGGKCEFRSYDVREPQVERLIDALNACTSTMREYIALVKPIKEDRVVSMTETARLLGRTRQSVSRMVREGRLHKVMRGGITGILLSEIETKR